MRAIPKATLVVSSQQTVRQIHVGGVCTDAATAFDLVGRYGTSVI
jgi:hypothetical protein